MINWVKYVCILSVVCVSHYANGALITRNNFSLDTSTNIITGNGLNWTRWDTLANVSINQALNLYSADGWRLASSDEMIGMYRSAYAFYTDYDPVAGISADNSRNTVDFSSGYHSVQLVRAINVSEPNLLYLIPFVLLFLGMCKSARL